ncbi:MAG: DUF3857 domain-containing protein [Candidatus Eisenbacteria bacterium]|nr:DUF3857 domain-containing protein [Candidatus Eisenbacteria bacterium]
MTKSKVLLWTALLALFVAVLPAAGQTAHRGVDGPLGEEAIRSIVGAAPAEAARPGEDGLILFEGVWVDWRDGRAEVRVQRLTKMYTEWAVEHLGDPRIPWDDGRQEMIVHASRTYLPGGGVVDTPTPEENGYSGTNEVTPDELALAVDHLDIREMVVTRVGLVREAVILLDYTIRDLEPAALPFHMLLFPQSEFPILEGTVSVGGGLTAETVNPPDRLFTLPEAELRGGRTIWTMKDLPARPHDSGRRLGDQIPWIALSSAKDWQEAVENFDGAVRRAAKADEALRAALMEIEEERPSLGVRETLESWTSMAKERTETIHYRPWEFLASPRTVGAVLDRAYATPAERAALLLACCDTRGWKTELILPARWAALSVAAPALNALGDPLLRVTDDGGVLWWVDPMGGAVSSLPPMDGGIPYFASDGSRVRRETAPVRGDRIDVRVFWNLVSGEGSAEVVMSGPMLAALGPEKPEELAGAWVADWCEGASVEDLRVHESGEDRIRFSAKIEASPPEPDDRGRIVIEPPLFAADLSGLTPPGMERSHGACDAVLFPAGPVDARALWVFEIPGDRSVLDVDPLDAKWNGAEAGLSRTIEGSRLTMNARLLWSGEPVRPEDYVAFRGFLARVLDARAARIALVSVGGE